MVRQPGRLSPRGERWFDRALAGVMLFPVLSFPIAGMPWDVTLLSAAQITPVFWRRHHARTVFAVVAAASLLQVVLVDVPIAGQYAFPVATYSVARFAGPPASWVALGIGGIGAVVASVDWLRHWDALDATGFVSYAITIFLIVVVSWALGALARTRAAYVDTLVERGERLEREAAQRAEIAAADERARIAREMHDVVAHGLSVIVVQADGARYAVARDPAAAATTLETISRTGRDALVEMRKMLGLLRSEERGAPDRTPQPGLADLPGLIEHARAVGTPVTAELPETWPQVADGVGLTAYRVVQEALTNVRKHAGPGAGVRVAVRATAEALDLRIEDDGRGAAAASDGSGLGLVGMRERVVVHGGAVTAGPSPGGGFAVSARIPT